MAELAAVAEEMAAAGTRLCLDLVCNHTADIHRWALAAKAGDPDTQALYWMFDDRRGPDRRVGDGASMLVLANMTETPQAVADRRLSIILGRGPWCEHVAGTDRAAAADGALHLDPYRLAVLAPGSRRPGARSKSGPRSRQSHAAASPARATMRGRMA